MIPTMLPLGYEVIGVDFANRLGSLVSGFTFIRGDFNQVDLDSNFEVVVACFSVEHFGLSGRYGSPEDPSGDVKAVQNILTHMVPEGLLFLTVPVGVDTVHKPFHRVYGKERLPQLMQGFEIVSQRFLKKEPGGPWHETSMNVALDHPKDVRRYALGEWILRKPASHRC